MADLLIVDDSFTTRHQLRSVLEGEGHRIKEAVDGLQGLVEAKVKKYDLIILDVNMPNMNGIEMTQKYREKVGKTEVPILLLTTEGSAEMILAGKNAGVNGWIVKPFDIAKLLRAVERLCGEPS